MFLIWLEMRWRGLSLTNPGVSCDCLSVMRENCWGSAVGCHPLCCWLRLCCCCCLDTDSPWPWRLGSRSPAQCWSPWAGGSRAGRAGAARAAPDSPSVATCKRGTVSINIDIFYVFCENWTKINNVSEIMWLSTFETWAFYLKCGHKWIQCVFSLSIYMVWGSEDI